MTSTDRPTAQFVVNQLHRSGQHAAAARVADLNDLDYAAPRPWAAKPARHVYRKSTKPEIKVGTICPKCFIRTGVNGQCGSCDI